MANYKQLKFTVGHCVEETSPGVFDPVNVDLQIRNADGSLETISTAVVAVHGSKGLTVDLDTIQGGETTPTIPCCVNVISGPSCPPCPDLPACVNDCDPPVGAPALVDVDCV